MKCMTLGTAARFAAVRKLGRAAALVLTSMLVTPIAAPGHGATPRRVGYSASSSTVNGLQMTIWTKPTNNGGATRIAAAAGRLWFAEHDTGKFVDFSANGQANVYDIPSAGIDVRAIASGVNEGLIWFAAFNKDVIGSLTPAGVFKIVSTGAAALSATGMSRDMYGNIWYTTKSLGIGKYASGAGNKFITFANRNSEPTALAGDGLGRMWFVERAGDNVGRVNLNQTVSEFPANFSGLSNSYGIALGMDGRIWFCDPARKRIGRMNLTGTGLTYFSAGLTGTPVSIVSGPDNQLYFGELEGRVGRISLAGNIAEYGIPGAAGTANFPIRGLAVGPGGNIWFVNDAKSQVGMLKISTAAKDCVKNVWQNLAACGWPGPRNTGYKAGTALKSTPARTITVDGTVVDGEKITGGLVISAKNVIVRNSWITESAGGANASAVIFVSPGASATISDNLLDGTNATHAGIWYEGTNLQASRNEIVGVNDGIFVWDADNFQIDNNYLHNFTTNAANGHVDGFQTEGASNGVIIHNTFDVTQDQTSAIGIWNGRRNSSNIRVESNLIAGGGFSIYAEDYSPSEANPAGGFTVTNVRFLNNMFSTVHYDCVGIFGIWFVRGSPTDGWVRSGNRVLETWQAVDTNNPYVSGWECR